MKKLTDFHPLSRVSLPDVGDLPCKGLTVLVGPNSSGKSQLLRDIYLTLTGHPRKPVVASFVGAAKPQNFEDFMSCLEAEGFVKTLVEPSGTKLYRPVEGNIGLGEGAAQVLSTTLQQQWSAFSSDQAPPRVASEFLTFVGRMLVAALFLERRLIATNQVPMFDHEAQAPQNDLQSLYVHKTAATELMRETLAVFSKGVWPDEKRGTTLSLKVADEGDVPSAEARLLAATSMRYPTIDTEGDGFKSYVAVCIALLVGHWPVCIIDEPEMCLHPPQAESLGRFIGRYGTSTDHATFIATHSSHVLRGILQGTADLRIVRLRRAAGRFRAHNVAAEDLRAVLAKPTVRGDSILDGIFAEAVVIVEADGDRMVYQAAWRAIRTPADVDVHFAPVGGTGGIADSAKLYRKLKIPVVVVADLDVIAEAQKFRAIVECLTEAANVGRLVELAQTAVNGLNQQRPLYTTDEARAALAEMSRRSLDWSNDGDIALGKELAQLGKALSRTARLKRGGIAAMDKQVRGVLRTLVREARSVGLFLVHVGELEHWLRKEGIAVSKENKAQWAIEAAVILESRPAGRADVWKFIRDVTEYLNESAQLETGVHG
jgi:hypothetical protein